MADDLHKPGLYRWKRQENPRVYSRSQNVTTNTDIQNWIQKVEDASDRAAQHTFGVSASGGRNRGKAVARATKDFVKDDEQAYNEAQELLSQWMEEKVNLTGGLGPDIDCNYEDDAWEKHELQSDVKREWDNMLANNYEEYGLMLSSREEKKTSKDIYNMDEDEAVASVMKNMLNKQVVRKEFKKDLGLDKWAKQKDPRTKMELRQQQVKENREKREAELRRQREEKQNRKIVQSAAKQLVQREERQKELLGRKEEMAIRKEMAKIRKEMREERNISEDRKAKERQAKEEIQLAARLKVAMDTEVDDQHVLEQQRRDEEKQRRLAQRLQELEAREAANNLKILHRHFSAWYNQALERRLQMGKSRAMYDWKLLLRAWNAWRGYVRARRMDTESRRQELEVINTQRNQQRAEKHSRIALLRKYFIAWQVYVHSEQERRHLESEQNNTRNKMAKLLEAAASGKLWGDGDSMVSTARGSESTARESESRAPTGRRDKKGGKERQTTADKINAMFETTRRVPAYPMGDSMSTDRSEVNLTREGEAHHREPQSRIPTEPWQVTRRHLDLTPEELAALPGGELDCSPEEINAKVLKKYGRQPWHKLEVSKFEHRHEAQKKILKEQKRQIMEQHRLIEELQFKSTHAELQKQLVEQKLVLEGMKQQMEETEQTTLDNENSSKKPEPAHKPTVSTSTKPRPLSAKAHTSNKSVKAPNTRPQSAGSNSKLQNGRAETARTDHSNASATPGSARTDVSRPASYTSTASEKSKYVQVLKNMDERSAERAKQKKEREEKRRMAEEKRLTELEAIAEAQKQQEEEEKRARVEAFKEKKRIEKQREAEKQLLEEKLRAQTEMADQHYQLAVMKYRGLVPFKKLVQMARQQNQAAEEHFKTALQRKVLLAWHHTVKEEWREKEALATEMSNFLCVKHAFQNWRLYKHHMIIEGHKARKHYEGNIVGRIFQAWRDYANEERVAYWEKDRRAREHYRVLLLKRHFRAWHRLPEEIEREKEKERRRAQLREKVAAILPDFELTTSVNESTEFR
ncbi:coiled-coil domain-containing protein 191-like [Mya arenaria]|uniref:coiled-coil domain-containing protein 191-like n=1 Tax=Mya arenaria TaxID=6604 RepID=UPI0022E7299C|nr:coiled-coil domain-containing protein 191-like [Mya arenaria]